MMLVFGLGLLVGVAVGVLLMGVLTAHKLTPHVSSGEAAELARRFQTDLGLQRACHNYAARAPDRECFVPAMASALDAYLNAERDTWARLN